MLGRSRAAHLPDQLLTQDEGEKLIIFIVSSKVARDTAFWTGEIPRHCGISTSKIGVVVGILANSFLLNSFKCLIIRLPNCCGTSSLTQTIAKIYADSIKPSI